jgi:hypothetical protein
MNGHYDTKCSNNILPYPPYQVAMANQTMLPWQPDKVIKATRPYISIAITIL